MKGLINKFGTIIYFKIPGQSGYVVAEPWREKHSNKRHNPARWIKDTENIYMNYEGDVTLYPEEEDLHEIDIPEVSEIKV